MMPTTRTEVVDRRERWKSKPNQEELMTGKKPDPRARRVALPTAKEGSVAAEAVRGATP